MASRLAWARAAEAARQLASERLGAALDVRPGWPAHLGVTELAQGWPRGEGTRIVLEHDLAHSGGSISLWLDGSLSAALVDRALGGEGQGALSQDGGLGPAERGVLGYLMARWLQTWDAPARVAAVDVAARLPEDLVSAPALVWPAAVRLGSLRGGLRLWVPRAAQGGPGAWLPAAPATLELTPPEPLRTPDGTWDTLRPGDVVESERLRFTREGSLGATLQLGACSLACHWEGRSLQPAPDTRVGPAVEPPAAPYGRWRVPAALSAADLAVLAGQGRVELGLTAGQAQVELWVGPDRRGHGRLVRFEGRPALRLEQVY